jgi:hypothetical protein
MRIGIRIDVLGDGCRSPVTGMTFGPGMAVPTSTGSEGLPIANFSAPQALPISVQVEPAEAKAAPPEAKSNPT